MKKQLIKIPVSAGELVDKITILEIKKKFVSGSGNIEFVEMELKLLNKELDKLTAQNRKLTGILDSHKKSLYNINLKLWKTENELRLFETKKSSRANSSAQQETFTYSTISVRK